MGLSKKKKSIIIPLSVGVILAGAGIAIGLAVHQSQKNKSFDFELIGVVNSDGQTGLVKVDQNTEQELILNIPAHKKLSKLTINGVETPINLINNRFQLKADGDKKIKATYVDETYQLSLGKNLSVQDSINLNAIPYNTELNLNINKKDNEDIVSLKINNQEMKDIIDKDHFKYRITDNTTIFVQLETKKETIAPIKPETPILPKEPEQQTDENVTETTTPSVDEWNTYNQASTLSYPDIDHIKFSSLDVNNLDSSMFSFASNDVNLTWTLIRLTKTNEGLELIYQLNKNGVASPEFKYTFPKTDFEPEDNQTETNHSEPVQPKPTEPTKPNTNPEPTHPETPVAFDFSKYQNQTNVQYKNAHQTTFANADVSNANNFVLTNQQATNDGVALVFLSAQKETQPNKQIVVSYQFTKDHQQSTTYTLVIDYSQFLEEQPNNEVEPPAPALTSSLTLTGFYEADKVVDQNTSVTLNLNIPANHKLVSLMVNGVESKDNVTNSSFTFVPTTDNYNIIASYEINKYTLTLGDNLSVSNTNLDLNAIPFGETITVNINVPENKKIDQLNVNGSNAKRRVNNNTIVLNMHNDMNVSVIFKDATPTKQYYSLTLGPNLVVSDQVQIDHLLENKPIKVFIDTPLNKRPFKLLVDNEDQTSSYDLSKGFFEFIPTKNSNLSIEFQDDTSNTSAFVDFSSVDNQLQPNSLEVGNGFLTTKINHPVLIKIIAPEGQQIKTIFENQVDKGLAASADGNLVVFIPTGANYSVIKLTATFEEKIEAKPDKKQLTATIKLANEKKASATYIYEDNETEKTHFDTQLTNAQAIFNNENSTQEEIDAVVFSLQDAMENLDGQFEKQVIDFKNISKVELYHITDNGELNIITGLTSGINSPTNYLVKITNENDEIFFPVSRIEDLNNKFNVVVDQPQLTYFNQENDPINSFTFIVDKIASAENVYTDFKTLVNAMNNATENQIFYIGADLHAEPISADAYVTNLFKGKLQSIDGQNFSISGLQKPLFKSIENATLSNFKILNSDVQVNKTGGVLASTVLNSIVNKLYIDANLSYTRNGIDTVDVGGIFGSIRGLNATKNVFKINLAINDQSSNTQPYGLLASKATGYNTTIPLTFDKNYLEGTYTFNNQKTGNKPELANIIGSASFGTIENLVTKINNGFNTNDFKISSSMNNTNSIYKISDVTNQNNLTDADAQAKLKEWGIDSSPLLKNSFAVVDFKTVNDYDETRITAYYNTQKLLPFYDRNTIVKYGNKISTSSSLFSKEIVSILTLHDNDVITNLYDKNEINKILVRFKDNSTETFNLETPTKFEDTNIYQYVLSDNLLFTPYQFLVANDNFIDNLAQEFATLQLDSNDFKTMIGFDAYNAKYYPNKNGEDYRSLYLQDAFNSVKNNIKSYLKSIVANYKIGNLEQTNFTSMLKNEILSNKKQIMLGLTYLERLFKINFNNINILNIMMFQPNFYNGQIKNLDLLKEIGSLQFEDLLIRNNYNTFEKIFKKLTNKSLFEFLEFNNQLFNNNQDMNDWFKHNTKAFVHEEKSSKFPEIDVNVYNRLKVKKTMKNYILPLLNLQQNNMYIISTIATIYFGGYGRSIDETLTDDAYARALATTNQKIADSAVGFRKFQELLYSISNEAGKNELKSTITEIFDGYYILSNTPEGQPEHQGSDVKRRWATEFDPKYTVINQFFGPIGRYYSQSPRKDSAYANQNTKMIFFDSVDVLGDEGAVTLTHELTHAYDRKTWLQDHNYRPGHGPEAFALGFFESASSNNAYFYGFNFVKNLYGQVTTNNSIDRFTNKNDFQSYLKGLFDTTYLIDGIEAEILLNLSNDDKARLFEKLSLQKDDDSIKTHYYFYKNDDVAKGYLHAMDLKTSLTAAEIANMNLRTIDDLIDQNIISKSNLYTHKNLFDRNNNENYYYVSLYYPIYAAYTNDTGVSGGLIFRRNAFELLANYGWDRGFVNYTTDALSSQLANGEILSDDVVLKKIFNGEYENYKAFRKAMFAQRLNKKDQIKPISIHYNNQNYNLTNGADIKALLQIAINKDLETMRLNGWAFERQKVKELIIKKFNEITNNFRTSIFNE
ncbi:hypothetical protein OF377_02090 [Ureaplasma sp. ES3154-GEN]|uniref:ZmpA/ZmpB/ZmpC family metallo-endopeptidase n=1 Tax=Ureaplasma sp. ES3154-GEN TaxID=2984844 RepID=UPI0021E84D42|nr:ZmpA/ZmpB/ZmpC family metallo-endopeptidase [Ureaplasma sp. ES3154-GEN]MCV3743660.1 hypothetical protein [Ureaplasma sp. ES3154-GEN]